MDVNIWYTESFIQMTVWFINMEPDTYGCFGGITVLYIISTTGKHAVTDDISFK